MAKGHNVNLRTLRYFVAIADAGGLTAAAAVLSIAQPALSRQIRDLESEMGVQLLIRGPRGVRLTPAGVTLYESAVRMLAEAARLRQQLAIHPDQQTHHVTVGVSPTLAELLLPNLLERCFASEPELKVKAREGFTPELLSWVERGMVDVAIVTNPEPMRGLSFHPLLGEPFALVSNKRLGLPSVIPLAQLPQIPVLITSLHRRLVEGQLLPLQTALQIRAEVDSVDAIREMVMNGAWATIMPISVFSKIRDRADIRISQIAGAQLSRLLMLARRTEKIEAPELEIVHNLIQAELERLTREHTFTFRD